MQKTAEAVSLGHPDKISDYISSYILTKKYIIFNRFFITILLHVYFPI